MMTNQSRYRGFASLDALASLVPTLLMLLILWQASTSLAKSSSESMERQETFNKLVSIADYTVKSGAVMREGDLRYPNWMDEGLITESYVESLQKSAGLESLHIGMASGDHGMCIYRLVVSGEEKSIKKLFVCGD